MSSRWKIFPALLLQGILCYCLTSSKSPEWTKLNDKCIKLFGKSSTEQEFTVQSACSNDGALFEPRTQYQNDYAVDYVKTVSPISDFSIGIIGKGFNDFADRVFYKWVYVSDQQSLEFSNWISGGPMLMEEENLYEHEDGYSEDDGDDWGDDEDSFLEPKQQCARVLINPSYRATDVKSKWYYGSCNLINYFICEKKYTVDQIFDEETEKVIDRPNCEECYEGFYLSPEGFCEQCQCSSVGSRTQICDRGNGKCNCHQNFAGHHCNICADGYHGDKCQFQGKPGI